MDDAEIVNMILKISGFCCNNCCEYRGYVMYPINATRIKNNSEFNINYKSKEYAIPQI